MKYSLCRQKQWNLRSYLIGGGKEKNTETEIKVTAGGKSELNDLYGILAYQLLQINSISGAILVWLTISSGTFFLFTNSSY